MIVIMTVKISFEAALTALKTMTKFIEQQPHSLHEKTWLIYSVYGVVLN